MYVKIEICYKLCVLVSIVIVMDEYFVYVESFYLSVRKWWFYKVWKIILLNCYGDIVFLYGWFLVVIFLEVFNC